MSAATSATHDQGELSAALGGRGDLSGEYADAGILFLASSLDWKP